MDSASNVSYLVVGVLYCIGGCDDSGDVAEVVTFDIAQRNHRPLVEMSVSRIGSAVASSTDEILICGGCKRAGNAVKSCEIFKPKLNR